MNAFTAWRVARGWGNTSRGHGAVPSSQGRRSLSEQVLGALNGADLHTSLCAHVPGFSITAAAAPATGSLLMAHAMVSRQALEGARA